MSAPNERLARQHCRSSARLEFLDGLRGLAALYVLLHHVLYRDGVAWTALFQYGREAVAVFIVLSGYCLMMPVVQDPKRQLRGGLRGFLHRRARRILVPYYLALLLWPAFLLVVRGAGYLVSGEFESKDLEQMFGDGSLAAHLLLYLNWRPDWIVAIAPAMWSVALEWQIYFVFALLLLPIYRQIGIFAGLAVATGLGLAPGLLLPADQNFDWTCPWFLGLFALGMTGAVISFDERRGGGARWDRLPWQWLALLLFACFLAWVLLWPEAPRKSNQWLTDNFIGAAALCLIIFCTRGVDDVSERRPWVLRALEARLPVGLGRMSYSLYLIHLPLLASFGTTLNLLQVSWHHSLWFSMLVSVPFALAGAYGFYVLVERRFSIAPDQVRTGPAPIS